VDKEPIKRPEIPDLEWRGNGVAFAPRVLSDKEIREVTQYFAAVYGVEVVDEK